MIFFLAFWVKYELYHCIRNKIEFFIFIYFMIKTFLAFFLKQLHLVPQFQSVYPSVYNHL